MTNEPTNGSAGGAESKTDLLDAALVKAQGAFSPIEKNREATIVSDKGRYKYKYADLSDVLKAVQPALTKNNLAQSQRTGIVWREGTANLVIYTELRHASGQKIVSEWPLALQQRPQQTGALFSYYRRYALCGLLGIAAEDLEDKEEEDALDQTQGQKPVQRGLERHRGAIPTNSGHRKTELQAWLKEFVADLHACSDAAELDALIASSDEMIAAVQKDLSGWWYGDERNPDYEAVAARIARLRKELVGEEEAAHNAPSLI